MIYDIKLTKWSSVKSREASLPCHVPREITHKETHRNSKTIDNSGFKNMCFLYPFIDG